MNLKALELVSTLSAAISLPVTCKIRLWPSIEETIQRALELEAAGCQLLTVHGRNRHHTTGVVSWDAIKAIKAAVGIPVGL